MPLKVGLLSGLSSQHIFIRSIYGAGALSGGTWGLQCGLIPFRIQKSISKQLKKIQSLNKIAHCELIKKQDFRIVPFSSESTIARLNGPKAASIYLNLVQFMSVKPRVVYKTLIVCNHSSCNRNQNPSFLYTRGRTLLHRYSGTICEV